MKFNNIEHEVIYRKLISQEPEEHTVDSFGTVVDAEHSLKEIQRNIVAMKRTRENHDHRPITSHRKFIGRFIVLGKKIIRKLLKWYIQPITLQQIEFNNSVTKSIDSMASIIASFENKLNELSKEFASFENKLNELSKELQYTAFNKKTYSQAGEDSILAYLIHVLGIPYDSVSYIDLGANHARELSNTYFLYSKGAKGILVEANPSLIPELQQERPRDTILNNCVDTTSGQTVDFYILNGDGLSTPSYEAAQEFCRLNSNLEIIDKKAVKTITYNEIVERYFGHSPTVLSIDIEGKDLEILESIDFQQHRPMAIVIEMIEYDTELNYQTKNVQIAKFMESKGYDEYAFTGINCIFIDTNILK